MACIYLYTVYKIYTYIDRFLTGMYIKELNKRQHDLNDLNVTSVCPGTDTNRQTRTGTNRGVMEPVNENEPQEPNRNFVGTEPKIIIIFEFDM